MDSLHSKSGQSGVNFIILRIIKIEFYLEEHCILKDMKNFLTAVKIVRHSHKTWSYQSDQSSATMFLLH